MQVAMHQLGKLAAAGAFAAAVGTQRRTLRVVLPVFAAEILGIRHSQRQTAAGRGAEEQLGVADASRIDYFSQPVCKNLLTLNIFKPHNRHKLIYKNKNNPRHIKK